MAAGHSRAEPIDRWAGAPSRAPLSRDFFARPAQEVAPDLLGIRLVSTIGEGRTVGVVVEVEAYLGSSDPASHAAARIGRTRRNESMFGPAGRAYVYLIYGMHWCLNVVTGAVDDPCAVLIRALDPVEGQDLMALRRGRSRDLTAGPGRLGQAIGLTGALDGHDLSAPPLRFLPGWSVPSTEVGVSGRIGISRAEDWPLRFFVRGNTSVSRIRS